MLDDLREVFLCVMCYVFPVRYSASISGPLFVDNVSDMIYM